MTVSIEIPSDIMASSRMTADEMRLELALSLYASGKLSVGKARELAELSLWQFRQIIAARQIEVELDAADIDQEIEMLKKLGRL